MEENNVNETPVENEVVENIADNTSEVENLKAEIEEANDRYKRLFAEFENYKKRTQKDRENIYGMVTSDVVSTMLPIMDNLEKASNVKTEDISYQEGVNLVVKQFASALKGLGLEEIETVGKPFDPEFHEAVSRVQDPTKEDQIVVEEFRKGYKIGNKVVRHSMVIVNSN